MRPLVVLGHFPEYIGLGWQLRASVFMIDPEHWWELSDDIVWNANVEFLNQAMLADSRFVLATDPDRIRQESYLAREIAYLISQGYDFVELSTGWELTR